MATSKSRQPPSPPNLGPTGSGAEDPGHPGSPATPTSAAIPDSVNTGANGPNHLGFSHWQTFVLVAICVVGFLLVTYFYCRGTDEPGGTVALFLMPSFFAFIFVWKFRDGRSWVASLIPFGALVLHLILWTLYYAHAGSYPFLAYLSLGFAGAVILLTGYVTYLLVRQKEKPAFRILSWLIEPLRHSLVEPLRNSPFSAVCFFFMLFMYTTFFFSFALAFHDQGAEQLEGRIDLYAERLPDRFKVGKKRSAFEDIWKVQFERGSAFVTVDGGKEPGNSNKKQLADVATKIAEYAKSGWVQVLLVGHTDNAPINSGANSRDNSKKDSYSSNFELSEERIHQVKLKLLQDLNSDQSDGREWQKNIEWLVMPFSNEPVPLRKGEKEGEYLLTVELALLPLESQVNLPEARPNGLGRRLDLLDYVYFMVYTITTTGYGDIIPVSWFAKYITSLANLIEVFFIVIFFNVLISVLGRTRPSGGKKR